MANLQRIDCTGKTVRAINREMRSAVAAGDTVAVANPAARHNLGVALLTPGHVVFDGSVGYYCAGMNDGATVEVRGSAGWGLAEGMLSGAVSVDGNAGNGAAASIRGGTVVVKGDCAARAGVSMKGGLLLVGGDAGYMTAFMMQKGTIIILGDAGDALADSMYEGVVYVGGEIASLGNDAVVTDAAPDEMSKLSALVSQHKLQRPRGLRKVVAGRKLWNFEHAELEAWRAAL
jgi:glutamate synthase domain-containing protein 3